MNKAYKVLCFVGILLLVSPYIAGSLPRFQIESEEPLITEIISPVKEQELLTSVIKGISFNIFPDQYEIIKSLYLIKVTLLGI